MPAYTVEVVEEVVSVVEVDAENLTLEIVEEPVTVELGVAGPQGPAGPGVPVFSRAGAAAVTTGTIRYYLERDTTVSKVRAAAGTPPVGSPLAVDVLLNGVSLLAGGPLEIPAGDHTAVRTIAVPASAGDYLTVDITQVGSTTPGADLTVSVTLD